jgi:drug/metabolite transporter (DMT)-like permease
VLNQKSNAVIAGSLLLVVVMWGGNNTGTKWLVTAWPPIWTGATRFLVAGFVLLAVLRFTKWLGEFQPLTSESYRQLWFRGGLSLAAYIVVFAWALRLTAASHVALYLGASPVWALLWEERPKRNWASARRYGAALLAVSGVLVLFWPVLKTGNTSIVGEFCGLASSLLWANYNHQSRFLSAKISGLEIAASAMWMAGVWLLPFGLVEIGLHGFAPDARHVWVQVMCIVFGGVVPYALWNSALRHWRMSQVMLFNNFIPLTTTAWAHFALGEQFTSTFWTAMVLIIAGVVLGQADWSKIFGMPESF